MLEDSGPRGKIYYYKISGSARDGNTATSAVILDPNPRRVWNLLRNQDSHNRKSKRVLRGGVFVKDHKFREANGPGPKR